MTDTDIREEIEAYAAAHSSAEPLHLYEITRAAHIHLLHGRMCSGHMQGRLLAMLTHMIDPESVLELGTYAAYSTLCIAEALRPESRIVTIEHNDELEDFIRTQLERSPDGRKIDLRIGDALRLMSDMEDETFDMIFIDADKRQYPAYYGESMRLLKPGGYILADNTLWDGHVTDPAYDRDAQTAGIRLFNDMVADDSRVEKVMLALRDGLTLIRKIPCQ